MEEKIQNKDVDDMQKENIALLGYQAIASPTIVTCLPSSPILDQNLESSYLSEDAKIIYINQPLQNLLKYHSNSNAVVTSKYTILTFIPKFLFESFSKLANFFFLVVSILQCIPRISNTYGLPTNAPVLLFVIMVDATFAIMEDVRRHRSDFEANSATCHVLVTDADEDKPFQVVEKVWIDIKVGDIIQVFNRELIPADLVILAVSEPSHEASSGICYVETKSLDGETNLKLRQALESTYERIKAPIDCFHLRGKISCELPNAVIHKFSGVYHYDEPTTLESIPTVVLQNNNKIDKSHPIDIQNVLLRGCCLRNTDYVYGLVINTGIDTKIMQSYKPSPSKWSSIMLKLNSMILLLCLGLFLTCAVASSVFIYFQMNIASDKWYLKQDTLNLNGFVNIIKEWIIMLFYYFLLLYQVVPISLYVSMTTVKFLQSMFIAWDIQMYHKESNTPAIVRTMALNEELGQISHVFTDKTGTLTRNVMEFRKCSIDGISYGMGNTEVGLAAYAREGISPPIEPKLDPMIKPIPFVNFIDPLLFNALKGEDGELKQFKIKQFFTHLSICHTVIPELMEDQTIRFSASSPDEQALVASASYFGFQFQSRGIGKALVKIDHKPVEFQILDVLEFNSTRKRMSVIVRTPDKKILLLTKGADSVIFPRLTCDLKDDIVQSTQQHLKKYADEGLRTLVIASKEISENIYLKWSNQYRKVSSNLNEIEKRKNNENNQIDTLMEEMETNLILLGATAIEDKLQEGVPSCLSRLSNAGIKIWMLTGDKQETAINIGYACSLVNNSMHQIIFNMDEEMNENILFNQIKQIYERFQSLVIGNNTRKSSKEKDQICMIIDGEILELALEYKCVKVFLELSRLCQVVICCRVSPYQKSQIVKLIKDNTKDCRTLAIGDGANDVAMIQSAHVGIGISGQEGMQAVNNSDYAIAQFKYLERLLLIHGRWNYKRMSKLVLYVFYKNIVLVLSQYWYGYLAGASGSKLYWEIGSQVYNIFFTGLPLIVMGILDRELPSPYYLLYPKLYQVGIKSSYFNYFSFFQWIIAAIYESIVIFLFIIYLYNNQESSMGNTSRVEYGMVGFSLTVLIVNLKLALIIDLWNWMTWTTWIGSIISWFIIAILGTEISIGCNYSIGFDECGSFLPTLISPSYWFLLILGCVVALLGHCFWTFYQRRFYPKLHQILQEKQKNSPLLSSSLLSNNDSSIQNIPPLSSSSFIKENKIKKMIDSNNNNNPNNNNDIEAYLSMERLRASSVPDNEIGSKLILHEPTGYAFSCDEATIFAESLIASNTESKPNAVRSGHRRSLVDARKSRSSNRSI